MSAVRLSLIARAVFIADGRVLLAHAKGHNNTFLPGGHVEPGESCITTIQRELREELGVQCETGKYLGAIEHRWWDEFGQIWHHELNHYFVARSLALQVASSPQAAEPHLEFFWSPVDDFADHNLLPVPLRSMIVRWLHGDESIWWGSTF